MFQRVVRRCSAVTSRQLLELVSPQVALQLKR